MTLTIQAKFKAAAASAALLFTAPTFAALSAEEPVKLAQNPVGKLISVP